MFKPSCRNPLASLARWKATNIKTHNSFVFCCAFSQTAHQLNSISSQDTARLAKIRNIGISAHIDSGKTTFTERVLFYTGRINAIHEVRGKDEVGAKMDSMELEREKGITIQSAATYCNWKKRDELDQDPYHINIIDTPGHIDFTIEVERALRVLDGAILVVCAASGVQSQTLTVDRQMRRYNVPRISFINKMDRLGADPWKVIDQLNSKLKIPAASLHVPIGSEDTFEGVIDLLKMKAIYNEGTRGVDVVEREIPEDLLKLAQQKRQLLIETLADVDENIAELFLEEKEPSMQQLKDSIRRATISLKFSPVLIGSALADKGVQNALDAVCDYLPNPSEVNNIALDISNEEAKVSLVSSSEQPFVGLAFKLEEGRYGQLTYFRIYQGSLKKGSTIINMRNQKKVRVSRLVRMHSNEMEDISEIGPGEICAIFGIECSSGDTFTSGQVQYTMTSMYVPAPVISYAIKPSSNDNNAAFSKALGKFQREDPTFTVHTDPESRETIISGMGELHLEVYIERLKREYSILTITGQPRVAYRETITQESDFCYTHKKQSGGAGQFAKVEGYIEPMEETIAEDGKRINTEFSNKITGARIPEEYIPGVERGFKEGCQEGFLIGHPIQGLRFVLIDGQTHSVDSSELAFRMAGYHALKQAFFDAKPIALEPVMRAVVTCPSEFQGTVLGNLTKRRAIIIDNEVQEDDAIITGDVPLANMFSYASDLRAITQGKGEFTMEFQKYQPVLSDQQKKLEEDYRKKLDQKKK